MTGPLGVLMLDTAFERIPGDAGHPDSYGMPVLHAVVHGAGSLDVVRDAPLAEDLVEEFCVTAERLQAEGARAIVSTCGFLVTAQARIAARVQVPVMVSSLSLFSVIRASVGERPIGVLTASAPSLGVRAMTAAGILPGQAVIEGMQDCQAFAQAFLRSKADQTPRLDRDAIEAAAVAKALALQLARQDLGALLLECGNLPPYAAAIGRATGLPVYSILDAARLIIGAATRPN